MSDRKPIWKQRVSFSKDRNVSITVWGPSEYDGHPTPPSIVIEEGKREGETWKNVKIPLTLVRTPNIIVNLHLAYAKALKAQNEQPTSNIEPESEVAKRELSKPTDDEIGYLKNVIGEAMIDQTLYTKEDLMKMAHVDEWVTPDLAEKAINELLSEGKIKPKFENLKVVGFTKAKA